MVKDYKGQDYGRCQTGEIKGCLDLVILFMQKFRQIPRKNIGRDNRQQAVVGEVFARLFYFGDIYLVFKGIIIAGSVFE